MLSPTRRLYLPPNPVSEGSSVGSSAGIQVTRDREQPLASAAHGHGRSVRARAVGGRAGGCAPRRARRCHLDRLAGNGRTAGPRARGDAPSRRGQPRARLPLGRRGGGLLRARLQRHALAALPLLRRPPADHARGLAPLPAGERALRGRDSRPLRARDARVGARLPPHARPADAAPARAEPRRRLLPTREEAMRGVLGADYVSFQIGDYARHFRSSCLRVLGVDSQPDAVDVGGRRVGIGVDPIGIDVAGFREVLQDPETERLYSQLQDQYEGRRLVLGVERLDYTKGIPQKLLAFERYLEQDPRRARVTTMLQVLVPSRLESPEYRQQRDEIELLIARINGRFGQPGITPVEYLHRNISKPALVALYRRADVMMVTPLRDGMNLVAHEFVFCQAEPGPPGRWQGSLLLSEFAGSAQVLPGALLVNPWNMDGVVERLAQALELDAGERRRRLDTMVRRVEALDCQIWAENFLSRLGRYSRRERGRRLPPDVEGGVQERLTARFARARSRTIMLDYDGTLRELEAHPDLAVPTPEITALLSRLAAAPRTDVHIVSGRRRRNLEQWFGRLPVHLCAEHGYLARAPGEEWRTLLDLDLSWMRRIERLLRGVPP